MVIMTGCQITYIRLNGCIGWTKIYYDGMRQSWYKRIEASGFDWQVVADILSDAGNEIGHIIWTDDPVEATADMAALAHNIVLTYNWVKGKAGG